jgi:hypothetical protein
MIGGFNNLIEVLRRVPEVRLDSLAIEGEGHTSAAVARTFLSGMKAVFRK